MKKPELPSSTLANQHLLSLQQSQKIAGFWGDSFGLQIHVCKGRLISLYAGETQKEHTEWGTVMPGQIRKMLLALFPITLAVPPDGSQPSDAPQHRPSPHALLFAGPLQPGLYSGFVSHSWSSPPRRPWELVCLLSTNSGCETAVTVSCTTGSFTVFLEFSHFYYHYHYCSESIF